MRTNRFTILALALLATVAAPPTLRAELPPSAYEAMQREAPDVLRINVLTVSTQPTDSGDDIEILAEVLKVGRGDAATTGDIITIRYQRERHPAGWVGPGLVPVPEEKAETVAYLKAAEDGSSFAPAAGMMTWRSF